MAANYLEKAYTSHGWVMVNDNLPACKVRKAGLDKISGKAKQNYFQIVIYDKYNKDYWLIIEINGNATLIDLDQFIWDIWVEE